MVPSRRHGKVPLVPIFPFFWREYAWFRISVYYFLFFYTCVQVQHLKLNLVASFINSQYFCMCVCVFVMFFPLWSMESDQHGDCMYAQIDMWDFSEAFPLFGENGKRKEKRHKLTHTHTHFLIWLVFISNPDTLAAKPLPISQNISELLLSSPFLLSVLLRQRSVSSPLVLRRIERGGRGGAFRTVWWNVQCVLGWFFLFVFLVRNSIEALFSSWLSPSSWSIIRICSSHAPLVL